MAWTAGPTATTAYATRTNISVTVPAGCSAGQLGIMNIYMENNSPGTAITPPSGWTALTGGFNTTPTPDLRIAMFYKVLVSGDIGAAAAFTHASFYCGLSFSSFNTPAASPVDVQGGAVSTSTSSPLTIAAITTTGAGDLVLAFANNFQEAQVTTVPSGYTTAVEVAGASSGGNWVGWKEQASAGTTGTAVVTSTSGIQFAGILHSFFQTGGASDPFPSGYRPWRQQPPNRSTLLAR